MKSLFNITTIVVLFVALLCINFIAAKLNLKGDFTEDNLFTLSDGSRKIAAAIDDEATIKYFFSASHEALPVTIKNYGRRVEELLKEFAELSPNLSIEVYDPRPDSDEEEMAAKYGISSAQAGEGDPFYMGAAVQYQDKTYQVPFFDPRKELFLEYDIAGLLARLKGSGAKKVLGILSGMSLTQPQMPPQMPPGMNMQSQQEDWLFVKELEKVFAIKVLAKDVEQIPADVDLLLVVHPMAFAEKTEYAVEQFILGGGKAVLVVDPSAKSVPDQANQFARYGMSKGTSSDLKRIFAMLGLKYDAAKIVVDRDHSTRVSTGGGGGSVQYPYWLSLSEDVFNKEIVLTSQLNSALFVEAGFFEPAADAAGSYISLIDSGPASGTIDSQRLQFMSSREMDNYDRLDKQLSLAGIVTGTFTSAFGKKPGESGYKGSHLAKAAAENSVMVIADADFLHNSYSLRKLRFFGQTMIQPINQNLALISNALEYIAGSSELISIRSRGSFHRPFERVEEIEKQAQAKWFTVERELTNTIQELQRKLNEMQKAKTQDNQLMLSREQQDEIQKFKLEQMEVKRKRREVRKNLRQDIERLGTILTVVNMTVMPLLVLLAGLYIYYRRTQGHSIVRRRS
ncbi:MAG: hypothetical protein GY868_21970 [Deltaproteobacteria bacterium]|nr:hypothetical protein [Deltaproteobacteria bacterium]